MMTLILWYLVGLVGSVIGAITDTRSGHDFKVSHALALLFWSILGPIILAIAICYAVDWEKYNRTLIKGKLNELE